MQDVDSAEAFDGMLNRLLAVIGVGYIGSRRYRLPAFFFDNRSGGIGPLSFGVYKHQMCSGASKEDCGSRAVADSAATKRTRSAHYRDLAL